MCRCKNSSATPNNLTIKELLIASHCKPWKDSNNIERLDVNNGMLLCAGHDSLFDKGLITFNIDGNIIISKRIETSQFKLLNINESINLKLRVEQIPYIKWHKEKVFNKISKV
ncbi:HNH endonuclease [Clostridium sp. CM028]|uniref:HNH endonuclease n=1 Tax=Clostridium sp. CM028 TaxID=2851575 RepID=UPI002714FD7B|nr:HNH endonuclease [Clostridium sp. CM028]